MGVRVLAAGGLILLLACAVSCAAVRARRGVPEPSGFLGDYSQLEPRPDLDLQSIYLNPRVKWERYDAIELDSVTLWASEANVKLAADEQQMLADVLYTALSEELGARFELSDRSGLRVLRLRAALTQARGANVPMRTLSTFVPQAYLISAGIGLSADVARTVGTATVELEITDSITDRRLVAVVDQRAGTKSVMAGRRTFQTWGDVEAASRFWARRLAEGLETLGVRARPDLP
jgi:hypothetical protein